LFDDGADLLYRHVEFDYEGEAEVEGVLELGLDFDTHRLRKLLLVHFLAYEELDCTVPSPPSPAGTLVFELPRITYCDAFSVILYQDGMEFRLSPTPASRWYGSGQVVFGVDATERVVDVLVSDMTDQDLEHVRAEFAYTMEARSLNP